MPKERYRRVRITTTDDNVILERLDQIDKQLSNRLKNMEQELRDLRSLVQALQKQPLHRPDDAPSESSTTLPMPKQKIAVVIPAEPSDNNEVAASIRSDSDLESDPQQKQKQPNTTAYILDETLQTVTDVVREWSQGSAPGMPALKELAKGLNQTWWFTTIAQRELFYDREIINSEVAFIAQEKNTTEEEAAASLEAHRAEKGYSLKTLARLVKSHQRRSQREHIGRTPFI